MSDSLFNTPVETTQNPQEPQIASKVELFANQLLEIRNERGEPKYDSIEKALDALKHSQEYIPALKTEKEQLAEENARLKAELEKRASVEDTISRFTNQRTPQEPSTTTEAPRALDEASVQEMLQRALTQREKQQLAESNLSAVRQALVSKFGDKAAEEVKAKAAAMGLPMSEVDRIAATSPSAVLAWFNASSPAPSAAPVRSTVSLPDTPRDEQLKHPGTSLLRGASSKDQIEFMRKIKDEVYRKHGIDS